MPQGDKRKYTDKQKRQAEHIEEGYERRGLSEREAERRANRMGEREDPAEFRHELQRPEIKDDGRRHAKRDHVGQ